MVGPAVLIHILSLLLLAGGGVGAIVMHAALEPNATASAANMATFGRLSMRFGIAAQIGALCMLLSGLFLLSTRGWADIHQPWLHLKLTIFVLLVLNGVFVARPTGQKISAVYARNAADPEIAKLFRRMNIFHVVQMIGLAAIVGLGVLGPRILVR
jgi:uncharacterized membrane protein